MILVNGESRHTVDVTDRGFQYGDGLFETIEIKQGRPVFLQHHFKRLEKGCDLLGIPFPGARLLTEEIQQLLQNSSRAVLKLMITRGSGGRGYRQPEKIKPTRIVSLHPFPDYPDHYQLNGVKARFCHHRLSHNPILAGLKHMNRLEQILARAEWEGPEIQEGLMLDMDSHVIEGTMSNLFLVKKNKLYTPKLDRCGVAGIIRNILMEASVRDGFDVSQNIITTHDVISADELFLTNSVIGIWPVRNIDHHQFKIGDMTRKAIDWLEVLKEKDLKACSIK